MTEMYGNHTSHPRKVRIQNQDSISLAATLSKSHSVSKSMDLDRGIEQVWELISSPGHLLKCHPFCKTNEALIWGDHGHKDELVYLNGLTYIRDFLRWSPNEGFDLLIGEEGGPQSFVDWKLIPISENSCKLTITVFPYLYVGRNRIFSLLLHGLYVRPRLERYLRSVLSGIDYVLRYREEVPRNHFGRHPWFS